MISKIQVREELRTAFLQKQGLLGFKLTPLANDASFRSYYRLTSDASSIILMDSPPEHYSLDPFIKIGTYLLNEGFPAPEIYSYDSDTGFMTLEDFGDKTINKLLLEPGVSEPSIYELIIDTLIAIQNRSLSLEIENYTENILIEESLQFINWYLPAITGEKHHENLKEPFKQIWNNLFKNFDLSYNCLVLRDYHADNLMYLPDRDSKVGLLDFQDAVQGSPAYDLVSLLEDARRDISPQFAIQMINYYLSIQTQYNRKDFLALLALFGAQRNLKILGVFARKAVQDKDSRYLIHIPRVKRYLLQNLKHPLLSPLKLWLDKNVPQQITQ